MLLLEVLDLHSKRKWSLIPRMFIRSPLRDARTPLCIAQTRRVHHKVSPIEDLYLTVGAKFVAVFRSYNLGEGKPRVSGEEHAERTTIR